MQKSLQQVKHMQMKKYIQDSMGYSLLLYIMLFIIAYYDYKKKIIIDKGIVFLFIYGFIESINSNDLENYFLGMCTYPFILLAIYSLEDYFEKQLIGFGDIKLMMVLGGIIKYHGIYDILIFYQILFIISGVYATIMIALFKNKKTDYIAFGPLIIITFMSLWR